MVAFQQLSNPANVAYQDVTTLQPVAVTQDTPLPVTVTSGATDQDVNVAAVGGTNVGVNGVPVLPAGVEYETVAAGQTAQTLGATGATGDYLTGLLVIPATTSPGNVLVLDNATSITVFAGGASSISSLIPFVVPFGALSVSGAWKVTTGANVSVVAFGNFT
jgi:hypothetical protein